MGRDTVALINKGSHQGDDTERQLRQAFQIRKFYKYFIQQQPPPRTINNKRSKGYGEKSDTTKGVN